MLWSTQETLELIESHLPPPLVTAPAFEPVKATARLLPDIMTSYYLECRLAADQEQVDFLACATAPHTQREPGLVCPQRRDSFRLSIRLSARPSARHVQ